MCWHCLLFWSTFVLLILVLDFLLIFLVLCFAGRTWTEITRCPSWKRETSMNGCSSTQALTRKLEPRWPWGPTISATAWRRTRPLSTCSTGPLFWDGSCWGREITGSLQRPRPRITCLSCTCYWRGADRSLRSLCGSCAALARITRSPSWSVLSRRWERGLSRNLHQWVDGWCLREKNKNWLDSGVGSERIQPVSAQVRAVQGGTVSMCYCI